MDDPRFAAAKRFAEEDDDDGDPEGGRSDGSDGEEAEDSGDEGTEEDEEGQQGASGGEKPTKTKSKSLTELSQKKLERMKASIEKTGAQGKKAPVDDLRGGASTADARSSSRGLWRHDACFCLFTS